MNILVLNGSPRKKGTVSEVLKSTVSKLESKNSGNSVVWENICSLKHSFCNGCMKCRASGKCILPADDAHRIADEIKACDMIVVGTPVYWGNMNGRLKILFDRLVGSLMAESKMGIPIPLHKGKKAVIVTACTTPFPFNYICGQSTGAVRAVKEVLKSSGFRITKKINIAGTKNKSFESMEK